MKGGAHPSPFTALSFPNSKKVPIYCWVDREFSSRRMAKPSLELTRYGDFLRYSRAALTTRPRRLSNANSLYRTICQRGRKRKERIDESKNVQTTPTHTYCKSSRSLPYSNPKCRTPRHWKSHHPTTPS